MRCYACGKLQKNHSYGRYWIVCQPTSLDVAVQQGRIKLNFIRRRRLEKLVQRLRNRELVNFPGILLCPDCLDIIEYRKFV